MILLQAPHNVVTYQLEDTYFTINSRDGVISLKRSLLSDGSSQYRLNVRAIDQGIPPRRTAPNIVIIDVVRNKNSPVFHNEPYSATIKQDASPGTGILNVQARDADTKVTIRVGFT